MKLAVLSIAALLAASCALAADNPLAIYFKPQTVVTLPAGQKINLVCVGEGGPVVVLLGGLGMPTEVWSRAQPLLARDRKTCVFDPPGYRFSDLGPLPLTAAHTADALHGALKAAGFQPPFILVAQSRAGFEARQFAHRHPRETAGLVLLDVNTALTAPRPKGPPPKRDPSLDCILAAAEERLTADEALFKRCGSPKPGSTAANPLMARAFLSQTENLDTDAAAVSRIHSYGAIPMVVLVAGDYSTKWPGDAIRQARHEKDQAALAAQSRRGRHRVVAGAGHVIMFDKPEAVATAVAEVVALER